MANSFNSNPVVIDGDMASGWRASQTLNTGNLPTTIQNPNAIVRQFGLHIAKLQLVANGTVAAGTVNVVDPGDSTVLWTLPVATGFTAFTDDVSDQMPTWRDFKVTGVTATVTKLLIWYRA